MGKKKAYFVKEIRQFSKHILQRLFRIDRANFRNYGVDFVNVEYIIVSIANLSERLKEIPEDQRDMVLKILGKSPVDYSGYETKVFNANSDGSIISGLHIAKVESASEEEVLYALGGYYPVYNENFDSINLDDIKLDF